MATNSVRATVTDANGNPVAGAGVAFSADKGAVIAATGTTDANGQVVQTLTNTTAGITTVTAEVGGVRRTAEVTFEPGPVPVLSLTMITNNQLPNAAGVNVVLAQVTLGGVPLPGQEVTVNAVDGNVVFNNGTTATTNQDGEAKFQLSYSAGAAAVSIGAVINGAEEVPVQSTFREVILFANMSVHQFSPGVGTILDCTWEAFASSNGLPIRGISVTPRQQEYVGSTPGATLLGWKDAPEVGILSDGRVTVTAEWSVTTNNRGTMVRFIASDGPADSLYAWESSDVCAIHPHLAGN